ncbi:MAG: C1 family peptidase [Prolixibacteraceae bacterium]|nr:C1 family peptidase [Prolixibacteraceae bacterium]
MNRFKLVILCISVFIYATNILAQDNANQDEPLKFEDKIMLPATSVKDQHRSGTCWAFAGISFIESEMLRMKKAEVDLSPMFIVYYTYQEKARLYVRMHGSVNFGAGGILHDVTDMIKKYGIVPNEVYQGLNYGEEKHVHGELDELLKNQVDAIIKNPNKKLSPVWNDLISSTLNNYLGVIPEKFEYKGKQYTPQSFARDYVGLNMDDYVEISSYTHHPFYSKFILEVPDNWAWGEVYNVPMNELEEIIDHSLKNGYSVGWGADVSEKGFLTSNKGVAMVPVKKTEEMSGAEISRWENLSDRQKDEELLRLTGKVNELEITQELRQVEFDNYQTTDDHSMHIVGIATDQYGKEYYKVKNSWGKYSPFDGFFYASKAYVNYKTMSIMVHKNSIPQNIKIKLGL